MHFPKKKKTFATFHEEIWKKITVFIKDTIKNVLFPQTSMSTSIFKNIEGKSYLVNHLKSHYDFSNQTYNSLDMKYHDS